MIRFDTDYTEGAHPKILERLIETNLEQTAGYGEDSYSEAARELVRRACGCPEAYVQFLVGGTQTNTTVIAAALRPHQGVIAHSEGHIAVHESGAIEAVGHKVLCIDGPDGKLTARQIAAYHEAHITDVNFEHTVQPKMVYLSQPTEAGTMYSRQELQEISQVCRERGLFLFLDGARLIFALTAKDNDLTLSDIAAYCDVFYIGGTKAGLLFGEAVVIVNPALQQDFRYIIKQRGGMLAKGRLLGVQFETFFRDDLYLEIGRCANRMAGLLKEVFVRHGCSFLTESGTNQQFPILENRELEVLKKNYAFSIWKKWDDQKTVVRFCTSWATEEKNIRQLEQDLEQLRPI